MRSTVLHLSLLLVTSMAMNGELCLSPGIRAVTLKISPDRPIVIDTVNPAYTAEAAHYQWTLHGVKGHRIALRATVADSQMPALLLRAARSTLRPGLYHLRVRRNCGAKAMNSCAADIESGQVITVVHALAKTSALRPVFKLESIRVHGAYPARATILIAPQTSAAPDEFPASLLLAISGSDPNTQQMEWRNSGPSSTRDGKLRFGQEGECAYKPLMNYGQSYTLNLFDAADAAPQPLTSFVIHIPLPFGVPLAAWSRIAEYEALRQDPTLKAGNERWLRYMQLQKSSAELAPYYPALTNGFIFTAEQLQPAK